VATEGLILLLFAMIKSTKDLLSHPIKQKIDVPHTDPQDQDVLFYCIRFTMTSSTPTLVKTACSISAIDHIVRIPMNWVAMQGSKKGIDALLKLKAPFTPVDSQCNTLPTSPSYLENSSQLQLFRTKNST
jgi:hypothetical protein